VRDSAKKFGVCAIQEEKTKMIRSIKSLVLRAAIALVVVASAGAMMMTSPVQAENQPGAAQPSPAASPQNQEATTKGAMECCKLGKSGITDKAGAMECCRLGKKKMVSSTDKDAAMACCKRGMKAGTNGPGR
jgi:hypothetical protein